MKKPKKFDLEVTFRLHDRLRSICVNVKECLCCKYWDVFVRICPVCGRYSKNQKGVYLQVARESALASIPLQDQEYEANIPEPKNTEGSVVELGQAKRPDNPTPAS